MDAAEPARCADAGCPLGMGAGNTTMTTTSNTEATVGEDDMNNIKAIHAFEYSDFVRQKSQITDGFGFVPKYIPNFLYDFQSSLCEYAIEKGRSAIFADCGLGKTPMELVCAENVVRHTNRPVLFLTPLAVVGQVLKESEKFGIEAHRSSGQAKPGINVANYEKLHLFNRHDFAAVICDESSILKNFDGCIKDAVTEFMREMRYRFLFTATAAPNDFVELGTSSEALGYLGHMDMLNRFFKNDRNTSDTGRKWSGQKGGGKPGWRFKGHSEKPFWQWVCSWARAIRRPSDLGFSDVDFILPELIEREQVVKAAKPRDGWLFSDSANGLSEQREERRRTIRERCERVAELVSNTGKPAVAWCHLNQEGDLLEKLIPDAVQVSGRDSDDSKEEKFRAFESGQVRVIIIKPEIGAYGLNWQHCAHTTMFAGYSFEKSYQAVRRFWRFGQTQPVIVDTVMSDGEREVFAARKRKSEAADVMFESLVRYMREGLSIERASYGDVLMEVPSWL